ncbi:hypothetical protein BPAE_0324g00040 [Botrytis paeoniae]|uniref:Uncharacterized protein n=1 Tax=Botrytis paeoniae TaxID=278948 RepID=A0A4Z1F6R0_9HELO|nr:hypothetical protein BPAE_0324g00040 [Botrytis paeoniae]
MTAASKEENTAPTPSHNPSETDDVESNTEIDIQAIILDYSSEEDEEATKKARLSPTTEKKFREKFAIRAAKDEKLARHKEREFGKSFRAPTEKKRHGPPPAESQPWFGALTEQQKEYYRTWEHPIPTPSQAPLSLEKDETLSRKFQFPPQREDKWRDKVSERAAERKKLTRYKEAQVKISDLQGFTADDK